MAYVEKLPSNKFRGGFRDARGRKRSKTFLERGPALVWATKEEEASLLGQGFDAGKMTVQQWSERWMAARIVEPTTANTEKARMRLILEEWGPVQLQRLSTVDIQSWEKRLAAGGMGPHSIRAYHVLFSSMIKAAVLERLIRDNPARFVQLPPAPRGREVYLTQDEVERVADHMPSPYDVTTRILPWLGFRWGELAGLRTCDVDLLRGTAQIRQVVTEIDGRREVKPYPKTTASFRTVPIPAAAAEPLGKYMAEHPRSAQHLVFLNSRGQPLSRTYNSRGFRAALVEAGVDKKAHPHDLRHSGASWLAQAGVPIFAISKWLGHTNIQTTMRYSHAAGGAHDEVRAAMDLLGARDVHGTDGE